MSAAPGGDVGHYPKVGEPLAAIWLTARSTSSLAKTARERYTLKENYENNHGHHLVHAVFSLLWEVPKEQWISAMKIALPAAFCNSSQYFRQCFKVEAVECEEVAASATRLCLNELGSQIPATLHQPKDGTYWGTRVGECAGGAYETTLIKKRISSLKCNDVSNWQ